MDQLLWRSLGWNEVEPPARPHSVRQAQDVLRDGVAPAKIIEKPSIDPGGTQIALNSLNICAHLGVVPSPGQDSTITPQASCTNSAKICCRVTPRISMRFVRLLSPLRILTAVLGVFKSCARNSASASFARPSTAGACSRTFRAPPISPAISSLLARGCTLKRKVTAPSRSWISSIRFLTIHYFASRVPKIAVPTRTSVAPYSIATSKSCDIPIDNTGKVTPSFFATSSRNPLNRRKYGRTCSAFSRNGGIHISPASPN